MPTASPPRASARVSRLVLVVLAILSANAYADWTLDNARSELHFVTVKAQDVAEVHSFDELSGTVWKDGIAEVTIQLASVDTLIPIRDERMRELLFKTDVFPTAGARTRLDLASLEALQPGESRVVTAEMIFTISGTELPITADLLVTRLSASRMMVVTTKPLVVNAGSVALAEGVDQLRDIAGLPSISKAVPVTFILQFQKDG